MGWDLVTVYVVDKNPLHVAVDNSTPVNYILEKRKKKVLKRVHFFEWLSISK